MISEEIHKPNLVPLELEDHPTAFKNHVLFALDNEKKVIALSKNHLNVAFDYLAKYDLEYEILILNEYSYEKLHNQFIEIKTDQEMHKIQKEQEDAIIEDDDFNLTNFLKNSSDILTSEESAPIIKFVNSLFYLAIKKRSSDIHIEIHEHKGEIRYRIDGVLTKHIELDKNIMLLIVSRIKVISNLDISEKRIPQDGRTQIKISNKTLDVRVSVLPTFFGERVVLRILMQSDDIPKLSQLGFNSKITKKLKKIIQNPYGMILVTGPTGSGKSTTLHSLLQQIVTPEKNIITIEDPVEYKSDKINQIQVNNKVGLTFASGLRSILRQDPDIIMLGEIRDQETATIAVQSALTGHLLFSTLHTNTAAASITRLLDMGIENFLISSSLIAVLSQRLVRNLCNKCKVIDNKFQEYPIYKANGCSSCNYTGYIGRSAIGELLIIDDTIIEFIKQNKNDKDIENIAIEHGLIPLNEQIKELLQNGITSLEEAMRIGFIGT